MPCVWSWVWCASSLLLVLLSCLCSLKNFLQLVLNTFLDSAIVVITGGIPGKTAVPMGGKRTWRINHSGDGFRKRCLLYCVWATTSTVEAYGLRLGSTLPWIAQQALIPAGSLCGRNTERGQGVCRHISRALTCYSRSFRIQSSDFWGYSGAWCAMT